MSNASSPSTVTITFKGNAQSLDESLKQMSAAFGNLGKSAENAAAHTTKAAHGAVEMEAEAKGMARGVEVAADAMALLSKESSEATMRLYEVRSLAADMRGAFSNMGAAISGGMAAFAGVAAIGFLKSSADEAMASQAAWSQLGAAIKGTGQSLESVKKQIEDGRSAWEKYGVTQGQVAAMTARGLGMGLSTRTILGDPKALADTAKLLGTDIPNALAALSRPRGANQVFQRLGLNRFQQQEMVARTSAMSGDQRAQFVMQQVEGSRFAGQADAAANTATGSFTKFGAAMKDLKEEVGTGVLPAMTQLANVLTGTLQAADAITQPFGGLANVLKTLVVPLAGLLVLHFTGLGGLLLRLGQTLIGRLTGSFAQTAVSIGDADTEAAQLAKDISAIPETATTQAVFLPDAAKEAWIANVLSVPTVAATTAIFDATAAESAIAGEETALAAIPKTVTTTAGVGVGVLPTIAVTAAAAVTTFAIANGALKPVTDAIGSLTGTITTWAVSATQPAVKVTGDVYKWTEIHVPAVRVIGDVYKWTEASFSHTINVIGNVIGWATGRGVHAPAVKVTGHVTDWTQNKGAHAPAVTVTATVNTITVPKGQHVHIGGDATVSSITVPKGTTVHIATPVTVSRIIVPKGTSVHLGGDATIDGVRVKKGQSVTIHGTGEIDGLTVKRGVHVRVHDGTAEIDHVQLRKGATVDVSGGKATIDTLYAKAVKMNLGALGPGLTQKNPVPYYIKYKVEGPNPIGKDGTIHVKVDQSGGGGNGLGGAAMSIGGQILAQTVALLLFRKIMGGGGSGPGGPGGLIQRTIGSLGKSEVPAINWNAEDNTIKDLMDLPPVTNRNTRAGTGRAPGGDPGGADIFALTGDIAGMLKSINWSAVGKTAGVVGGIGALFVAAFKGAAGLALKTPELGGGVVTVFTAVFKQIQQAFDKQIKGGGGGPRGTALINVAPLIGAIATVTVQAFSGGLTLAQGALSRTIGDFLKSLVPTVSLPKPSTHGQSVDIPGATDPHKKPPAAPGYTVQWDAKTRHWMQVPKPPHHATVPTGAGGFGASLLSGAAGQSLAQHLANTVHLTAATHHAAAAKAGGQTVQHISVTINEAHNPKATEDAVIRALSAYNSGISASRRLH